MVARATTAAAVVELQVETMSSFAARLLLSLWYGALVLALLLQCSVHVQWQARELCSSAVVPLTRLTTWQSSACVMAQPYWTHTTHTRVRLLHDDVTATTTTVTTTSTPAPRELRYRLEWSSNELGMHLLHRKLTRFVHLVLSMASPMAAMTPVEARQRTYHVLVVLRENAIDGRAAQQPSLSLSSSSSSLLSSLSSSSTTDNGPPALYVYNATVVCYRDRPRCNTVMLPPTVVLPHNTSSVTLTLLDVVEELAIASLGNATASSGSGSSSSNGSSSRNDKTTATATAVGVAYQRVAYTLATLVWRYVALAYTTLSLIRFVYYCGTMQRHPRRAVVTRSAAAAGQPPRGKRGRNGCAMLYEQRWVVLLQLALLCYLDPLFAAGVWARDEDGRTLSPWPPFGSSGSRREGVVAVLSTLSRYAEVRVPAYFVAVVVCFCFATIAASYSWSSNSNNNNNNNNNDHAAATTAVATTTSAAPDTTMRTRPPCWVDALLLLYVLLVVSLDTLQHVLASRQPPHRARSDHVDNDGHDDHGRQPHNHHHYDMSERGGNGDWAGLEPACTSASCRRVLYAWQAVLLGGVLVSMLALHRLKRVLGLRPYLDTRPQQLACRMFIFVYTTAWMYVAVQTALVAWRYPQLVQVVYYHPLLQLSPLLVSCVFVHLMTYVYTPTRRTARHAPLRARDGRWRWCVWPRAWYDWLDAHGGDMYVFRSEYEERQFYAIQAGLLHPRQAALAAATAAAAASATSIAAAVTSPLRLTRAATTLTPHHATPLLVPAHALPTVTATATTTAASHGRDDATRRHVRSHSTSLLLQRHADDDDDDESGGGGGTVLPQRRLPRVASAHCAFSHNDDSRGSHATRAPAAAASTAATTDALYTAASPSPSLSTATAATAMAAATDVATTTTTTTMHAQSAVTPCCTDTTAVAVDASAPTASSMPPRQASLQGGSGGVGSCSRRVRGRLRRCVCNAAAACAAALDLVEDALVTRPLRALLPCHAATAVPPARTRHVAGVAHAAAVLRHHHHHHCTTRSPSPPRDVVDCQHNDNDHARRRRRHGRQQLSAAAATSASSLSCFAFFNLETAIDCANLAYEAYACAYDTTSSSPSLPSPTPLRARDDARVHDTAVAVVANNDDDDDDVGHRVDNNDDDGGVWQSWLERTAERVFVRFFARPRSTTVDDNDDDAEAAARRPLLSRAVTRLPSLLSSPVPPVQRVQRRVMHIEAYGYTRLAAFEVRSVQVIVARLDVRAQRQQSAMHDNDSTCNATSRRDGHAGGDGDCYVDSGKAPRLVIAFRGTCNATNAKQNVRVRQRAWKEAPQAAGALAAAAAAAAAATTAATATSTTPAMVHCGYLELWMALKECVLGTVLRTLQHEYQPPWQQQQQQQQQTSSLQRGRRGVSDDVAWTLRHARDDDYMSVYVTGHSMGGAVAALCAYSLSRLLSALRYPIPDVTVYTFGQPRFCNRAFQRRYNRAVPRTFRVVNENDVVATMRVCGGCHVGVEVDVDRHGNYVSRPMYMERLFRPTSAGGRRSALRSHAMLAYALSLNAVAQRHAGEACPVRCLRPYAAASPRSQREEDEDNVVCLS